MVEGALFELTFEHQLGVKVGIACAIVLKSLHYKYRIIMQYCNSISYTFGT